MVAGRPVGRQQLSDCVNPLPALSSPLLSALSPPPLLVRMEAPGPNKYTAVCLGVSQS